jgi:hypothetical protein
MDAKFRDEFHDNPRAAAKKIGIDLTEDDVNLINDAFARMDWGAVEALGPLARAALPREATIAAWGRVRGPDIKDQVVKGKQTKGKQIKDNR